MADITVNELDVAPVRIVEHYSAPAGEPINRGARVSFNAAGRLVNAGASGTAGIAQTKAKYGYEAVTYLVQGTIDLGDGLSGMGNGDDVHSSSTAGAFADAAGTDTEVVGKVQPAHGTLTPRNLLRVAF